MYSLFECQWCFVDMNSCPKMPATEATVSACHGAGADWVGPVDVGSRSPTRNPRPGPSKWCRFPTKPGPWGGLIWREGTQPQRMVFLFVKYHCPSKFYISKWPRSSCKTQWQPKMLWCRSVAIGRGNSPLPRLPEVNYSLWFDVCNFISVYALLLMETHSTDCSCHKIVCFCACLHAYPQFLFCHELLIESFFV